jgi:hypothetical protein
MKKLITFFIAVHFCTALFAQTPRNYQWQWGITGGSAEYIMWDEVLSGGMSTKDNGERVRDIAVDTHNNIYFTSLIANNAQFMGYTINGHNQVNNRPLGSLSQSDVFIGSVDCAGNYRWHYTIGSYMGDGVSGIETDTLGGVYVSLDVGDNLSDSIWFDNDTTFVLDKHNPALSNGYTALLKLDTLGNRQWIKWAAGNINMGGLFMVPQGLQVEPDGTIHWLMLFKKAGTYADGQIVITDSLLRHSDMAVLRYDRNGNFLGYSMLPVLGMGKITRSADCASYNRVEFFYNSVAQQYQVYGWIVHTGVKIATDSIPKSTNRKTGYLSYIASFDTAGNYLWHYKVNWHYIWGLDFDKYGNTYINAATIDFAGIIHDEATLNNSNLYGNSYIIKIYPDGTVDSSYITIDCNRYVMNNIKYNDDEIAIEGRVAYSLNQNIYPLLIMRVDTSLTLIKDSVVWHFDPNAGVSQAANNSLKSFMIDNQGNYLLGGAVGTACQLSPTVRIANSGIHSLSDFFIAKYAKYDCGEDVEPSAVPDIKMQGKDNLPFYPNPAKDILFFDAATFGKQYMIYSIDGKLMQSGKIAENISISNFTNGIYLLQIESKNYKLLIIK